MFFPDVFDEQEVSRDEPLCVLLYWSTWPGAWAQTITQVSLKNL